MREVGGIFLILGLVFVVAALLDKRRADSADQELIEDPFRKGLFATRERVYKGVVTALIVGVFFLVLGIVFLFV